MKNILFILLALLALGSCKKDRPELAPPASKIAGIQDDWTLNKVIQVDEISQRELDVSQVYIGLTPMQINFKISGTDTAYSVVKGTSANYFGNSGTWKFDDNLYPTKLILNHDGNDYQLPLLRTVREGDPNLEIKYRKICSGKNVVTYKYIFKRS